MDPKLLGKISYLHLLLNKSLFSMLMCEGYIWIGTCDKAFFPFLGAFLVVSLMVFVPFPDVCFYEFVNTN